MKDCADRLLSDALAALGLPPDIASRVSLHGDNRLSSCFAVTELASASIAAACLAVSELVACVSTVPEVSVSHRLASLWFGMTIQPRGWTLPAAWDSIAGDYPAGDGWIKLHTNAPHHRAVVLAVLGCDSTRAAVGKAVARWNGDLLEREIVQAGGCAARLRSRAEWRSHPQGQAVSREPLIVSDTTLPVPMTANWQPSATRPLAGLRVLDLTRVLAGPVATRFLAGYGAQVLRLDPPGWDEPGVIPEVALGKRCARLDLRDPLSRERFEGLLAGADILVHGYRPDALDRLGYDAATRQAIRPGLVDVSLDAYGQTGPWRCRRGFDSLVQFSTGIAHRGMQEHETAVPVSLPVQALDHATGYLMAAAAVRGILARLRGEACLRYSLSLARTAEWLWSAGTDSGEKLFPGPAEADFSPVPEQTEWGKALRILPPASISKAPTQWSWPARPLGSATAEWQ